MFAGDKELYPGLFQNTTRLVNNDFGSEICGGKLKDTCTACKR